MRGVYLRITRAGAPAGSLAVAARPAIRGRLEAGSREVESPPHVQLPLPVRPRRPSCGRCAPASSRGPFAKLGLPDDASDVAIIETACRKKCIIVTANGEHFRPAAVKFIRQSSRRRTGGCHDLSGLVVLPSGLEAQRRLLREAPQRMRYEGKLVGWADVSGRSYYVKLAKDGDESTRQVVWELKRNVPMLPTVAMNDTTSRRDRRTSVE